MKTTALLCLLGFGLLSSSPQAAAQGSPVSCPAVNATDMVSSYASWDWETPRTDPNYCKTWAIRRPGQTQGVAYGAPWEFAQNGKMLRIAYDKDYTRQKGWELLRMNLGALSPIDVPYVILYNKYTSMIRTYFWLDNRTYQNGAVITMSHSSVNSSGSTSVMAMTNTMLVAPDKYLTANSYSDEMISYVAKMTSQTGWVVGEFTATYDPNFGNTRYNGNALEFSVFGTVTSNITLGGALSFKTDAQEGYALAGPKNQLLQNDPADPTRLKKFLATGKRVLGSVSADDADKFLDKLHEGGVKMASSKNTKASNTGLSIANATRPKNQGGGLRKTVGTVLGAAGMVSSAFGIIGQIVGAIWPAQDESGNALASEPAFTPTISEGTIQMSGSITTTYPLTGVSVQLPGTAHNGNDRSTQPYYNCPLGLFNIKNTPVLNKMTYTYISGEYSWWDPCGSQGQDDRCVTTSDYGDYHATLDSYQVQNDLLGAFNKPAGLELVSAKAALVGETPGAIFTPGYTTDYPNGTWYNGGEYHERRFDYMEWQLNAGILDITRTDVANLPNTVQTPFVDLGCFKNMTMTVPTGSKVYVRVMATLRVSGAVSDNSPLIYFVQDYAVQTNTSGVTATNPRFVVNSSQTEPPFSNLGAALTGEEGAEVAWGEYTTPGITQTMDWIHTSPEVDFGWGPMGVTINHPNTAAPTIFAAGGVITLNPGFSVTSGTNFIAGPILAAQLTCTPSQIDVNNVTCPYNNLAYRATALASETARPERAEGFVVYPNPTHGLVTVETEVATANQATTLTLYDLYGKTVRVIRDVPRGSRTYQLDLQGYPTGVYLLKMTSAKKSFSQKVVVE
ncbi:T9SS type A sorting domain-containing protein [Hymenobacter sp. BT635]|uniref:T9SS type A sorting domain-containing protein n=1 Tax=Hymenobacter nitidus TaxID=2880929 RepID=A0ABS8AII5_9BACT|nr:T9SS type A sorting domain-containing protein [Hymenobacter nitidus]MCB2380080.1 T9SS type A sorting domain-containing protein [Hymenobacter nitidus]